MSGTTVGAANADDVERACAELSAALEGAGITLPSLGVSRVRHGIGAAVPLIDLGLCNARTARRLAAALRGGLPAPAEHPRDGGGSVWPGGTTPPGAPGEEQYDDLTPEELYARARTLGEEVRRHLQQLKNR